ncbi:MarR family transcriptional regulator [Clostridium gasigenes]|uniref:MarR family transcriptional regulator n=1 Tax=Clostridium gasigenes TaxID=94869 RepID=A0A1H0QB76_9CLOT|nr:MarR family transcriptional regulator [Clostridium gasigenes]MBB6623341.1 MarR family transcriptional regulator [Clostridium gasigenes]MBB6713241.1 MarR family transcriptional regulator [Clostridium gasigenes]MBU3088034.1 MarR family transcriptional regulator [Clostridium gasigenes]MBU3107891.1 MarR family transcriptional regulator [Clostridium gasigenes]SDP13939.1 hypothetical protein SAMN04488529_102266 [Clostridium gasigenes]
MELTDKIIELLSKSDSMRPGEIAEALAIDKKEVDKAIKQLKNEERLISPKRCYYSLNK